MLRNYLAISFICLFAYSCTKDAQDLSGIELGYDYFPNKSGSYVIYNVDSTYYGITEETFSYQVKEVISDEFVDGTGQPAYQVQRFIRHFPNQPWILADVWVQKRTTTAAERVEENVRFIKLEFPISEGGTWQGNAYNTIGDWEYTYENVDQPADIGQLEFSRALKVNQRYSVNLVDQEIAFEIYAYGIGLVYKQFTDVNIQNGDPSGVDIRYTAIAYSNE